jgi:uncharacterized membrane protein
MNSLEQFLNTLLADLDDLPVYVVENTKEYYESYFLDAKEEGLSDSDILIRLGDPASISSQIKLDYYLYQPKETNHLFKKLFSGVLARKAAVSTTKFITAILSFALASIFYIMQIAFALSAVGALAIIIYIIYTDLGFEFSDKFGLYISVGALSFSMLMLLNILCKKISFTLRKLTINLIRKNNSKTNSFKKKRFKPAVVFYLILLLVSSIIISVSPISEKLYNIWMSNQPNEYQTVNETFDITEIDNIVLNTYHTNIEVVFADVEEIELNYEKPSYFNFSYSIIDRTLKVSEVDNFEIPFIEFFARHEGTLDLIITLPNDYLLDNLTIWSIGSNMDIQVKDYDLSIYTQTSNIELQYYDDYNIFVETKRGIVEIEDIFYKRYNNDGGYLNTITINGISTVIHTQKIEE